MTITYTDDAGNSYRAFRNVDIGNEFGIHSFFFDVDEMEQINSSCNVEVTSSNGGVTITGLPDDVIAKLLAPNYSPVFECNHWDGNPCEPLVNLSLIHI